MLEATYRVTIERHVFDSIPVLSFEEATESLSERDVVFVIHGLTSRKERHLDLCLRLAGAGFRAVAFDLPGHGERRDASSNILYGDRSAPGFGTAFLETVLLAIQNAQSIADAFALTRYAAIGHSMGGMIAVHLAMNDARLQSMVNIAGSIDIAGYPVPDAIRERFGSLIDHADMIARASELTPRPILLLHGEQDETVPVTGAHRFYSALQTAYADSGDRARLILYPDFTHRDFTEEMMEAAIAFLKEHA